MVLLGLNESVNFGANTRHERASVLLFYAQVISILGFRLVQKNSVLLLCVPRIGRVGTDITQVSCASLRVKYISPTGSSGNASSVVRGQGFVRWIQGLVRRGRVSS